MLIPNLYGGFSLTGHFLYLSFSFFWGGLVLNWSNVYIQPFLLGTIKENIWLLEKAINASSSFIKVFMKQIHGNGDLLIQFLLNNLVDVQRAIDIH